MGFGFTSPRSACCGSWPAMASTTLRSGWRALHDRSMFSRRFGACTSGRLRPALWGRCPCLRIARRARSALAVAMCRRSVLARFSKTTRGSKCSREQHVVSFWGKRVGILRLTTSRRSHGTNSSRPHF
eukprot:Amastigsp_a846557_13.p4 type:complete len:128 gc:universal Amastigsp_a846557_13:299-682(+)